jgi:hypothetical protein
MESRMGRLRPFTSEKLVMPILISGEHHRSSLLRELHCRYGEIDYTSIDLPFTYTRYYDEEMGTPITRFFVSFRVLVDPGTLARIKTETNDLEDLFRESGKRRVNLDPGLLSGGRFILATTKNAAHRIPLADGVYGETTLVYEKGRYRPLEWTYPDYRSGDYTGILAEIRQIYLAGALPGG